MYKIDLKNFRSNEYALKDAKIVRLGSQQALNVSAERQNVANALVSGHESFIGSLEDYAFTQFAEFYFTSEGRLSPVVNYDPILRLGGVSSRPTVVSMVTTKRCNFRCPHCYNDSGLSSSSELSKSEKLDAVEYFGKWGVSKLYLTGGEPLLDPAVGDILDIAARYHMKVNVSTNGWYLPEKVMDHILAGTMSRFNISLDGPDAQSHDSFRRKKGSFNRAIETIRDVVGTRKVDVVISTAVHKGNLKDLDRIADLSLELGADMLSMKVVTFSGRANDTVEFVLDGKDLAWFQQYRDSMKSKYADNIDIDGKVFDEGLDEVQPEQIGCTAGFTVMMMDQDGYLMPCETLGPELFPNIKSVKPVNAWLDDERFQWFREYSRGQSCSTCPGRQAAKQVEIKVNSVTVSEPAKFEFS